MTSKHIEDNHARTTPARTTATIREGGEDAATRQEVDRATTPGVHEMAAAASSLGSEPPTQWTPAELAKLQTAINVLLDNGQRCFYYDCYFASAKMMMGLRAEGAFRPGRTFDYSKEVDDTPTTDGSGEGR